MLNVITIICLVLMILMFVWILNASHNICGAIQAILDIQHSRDKIENLACRRIMELQADKGKLTDENRQAKEIIKIGLEGIKREFIVAGNTRPFAKEALMLCNEYCEKAEAFLKE